MSRETKKEGAGVDRGKAFGCPQRRAKRFACPDETGGMGGLGPARTPGRRLSQMTKIEHMPIIGLL